MCISTCTKTEQNTKKHKLFSERSLLQLFEDYVQVLLKIHLYLLEVVCTGSY